MPNMPDVTSLDVFIGLLGDLKRLGPHPTTFRGQRKGKDAGWQLHPTLTRVDRRRLLLDAQLRQVEEKFVAEFRRRLRSRPVDHEIDHWDATITGRHHLLPTRLFDWTENPLVALYFAVQGEPEGDFSFVYGTHGQRLFHGDLRSKADAPWRLTGGPYFFITDLISPRVFAQRSVLCVWGDPKQPYDKVVKPDDFWEFRVPRQDRDPIRADLDLIGINEETLFPDLDATSRYLDWKCEKEGWTDRGSRVP